MRFIVRSAQGILGVSCTAFAAQIQIVKWIAWVHVSLLRVPGANHPDRVRLDVRTAFRTPSLGESLRDSAQLPFYAAKPS